jgi:hypothetical protein
LVLGQVHARIFTHHQNLVFFMSTHSLKLADFDGAAFTVARHISFRHKSKCRHSPRLVLVAFQAQPEGSGCS